MVLYQLVGDQVEIIERKIEIAHDRLWLLFCENGRKAFSIRGRYKTKMQTENFEIIVSFFTTDV